MTWGVHRCTTGILWICVIFFLKKDVKQEYEAAVDAVMCGDPPFVRLADRRNRKNIKRIELVYIFLSHLTNLSISLVVSLTSRGFLKETRRLFDPNFKL